MGERLPSSRPLGPRSASETSLNQGSPKKNKRAIGAAQSAIRASNPDVQPVGIKKDSIRKVEARVEMTSNDDDLVGSVSLEVPTIQPGDMLEGQTVVFGNVVPATLGNVFPEPTIDPFFSESSLRAVTEIARTYPGGAEISLEVLQDIEAADDFDPQELMDAGTTAIDLSDKIV